MTQPALIVVSAVFMLWWAATSVLFFRAAGVPGSPPDERKRLADLEQAEV